MFTLLLLSDVNEPAIIARLCLRERQQQSRIYAMPGNSTWPEKML